MQHAAVKPAMDLNETEGGWAPGSALLPAWSLLSQLFILLLAFGAASLAPKTSPRYQTVNEFLCSVVWVAWGLEGAALAYTYSSNLSLLNLFIRLVLCPYLLRGAFFNPVNVFLSRLQEDKVDHHRRPIQELLSLVAMEILGTFCGVYYYYFVWSVLGVTVSPDHDRVMEGEIEYFLRVSPVYGFALELAMTFICYLPSLFMKQELPRIVIEAAIIVSLVMSFGSSTGAFMNPISALSFILTWHTYELTMTDYLTYFAVFWLGPCAGAWLVAMVGRIKTQKTHKHTL